MRISDWSSDVCSSDLMTPRERSKPELMNAKRKIRVAKGSGTTVQDVNRLLKMHQEMATTMKKIKKMGDRKSVVEGKSVSVRVDNGGRRTINNKHSYIHSKSIKVCK